MNLRQGVLGAPIVLTARLVFRSGRVAAIGALALVVVQAVTTAAAIAAFGALVGRAPSAAGGGGVDSEAWRQVTRLVVLLAIVMTAQVLANAVLASLIAGLGLRFKRSVEAILMSSTLAPAGIAHLENPRYLAELERSQGRRVYDPSQVPGFMAAALTSKLRALVVGAILFTFHWWVPAVLAPVLIFLYWSNGRWSQNIWQPFMAASPQLRRSEYLRRLVSSAAAAKEVRVFDLSTWFIDRMEASWLSSMTAIWRERRRLSLGVVVPVAFMVAAYAVVFVVMAREALDGAITLGDLATFGPAALLLWGVSWSLDEDFLLLEYSRTIPRLLRLRELAHTSGADLPGQADPPGDLPTREVRFEEVTFSYPGSDRKVLDCLGLSIPVGQTLAIVGPNGTGKTTVTKLLARLYDPDDGRITVDGHDLRELRPGAWRTRVSVIFQDFLRYELSARDNIALGRPEAAGETGMLADAVHAAGADDVLAALPSGWDTVLSRAYEGGSDLSGGQWQKVALARALFGAREGGLLILDEPAASLDVRAETELFKQIVELGPEVTTILISHRLSSVRHADRIVVLLDGGIVEDGDHETLMAHNGRYAEMFRLQAARFPTDEPLALDADGADGADAVEGADGADGVRGDGAAASGSADDPRRDAVAPTPPGLGYWAGRFRRSLSMMVAATFRTAPLLAAVSLILVPLAEAATLLNGLWLKGMVSGVVAGDASAATVAAALIAATLGLTSLVSPIGTAVRLTLTDRMCFAFDRQVAEISARMPGLGHYERPDYADTVHLLTEARGVLGRGVGSLVLMIGAAATMATGLLLLTTVSPVIVLLPLLGLPSMMATARNQRRFHEVERVTAGRRRLAEHLRTLATTAEAGRELRVFGLADEILDRHSRTWEDLHRIEMRARWAHAREIALAGLLPAVAAVATTYFLAWRVIRGSGEPGELVLAATVTVAMSGTIAYLVTNAGAFMQALRTADRYLWLVDVEDEAERARGRCDNLPPERIDDGIELRDVSFTYPGTAAPVLEHVNLRLPAGAVVAIVGENGAGKTTLVKLLCRFYDPTEGQITVDGIDLTSVDPRLWRRRSTAAFQDFARFELLARESVGVGELATVHDDTAVTRALHQAGAADLPARLPCGLDTHLGREWDGVELSGGQWQKVALARAFMRGDALMLVLDEPTASLDAEAEHALFERFAQAARRSRELGAITLLVSHRFSTVRMADLIVVVADRRVVECGTHRELMRTGGPYAQLYSLQARSYLV